VKQFFDSMDLFNGPAGTRWAALFYGALMSLPAADSYMENRRARMTRI
jgi:hypothetical protein